mgnify:CR=1 FL=1
MSWVGDTIGEDFYGPAKVKATQARNAAERERAALVASRDGLFGQIVLLRQTLAQAREDLVNESAREAAQAEAVQAALKERLEAAGVEVLGPVRTSPGSTSIYFYDPNGKIGRAHG